MIWVVLLICVLLTILGAVIDGDFLPVIFGGLSVMILIVSFFLIGALVDGRVIDEKIDMYTQENTAIEESIDKLVSEYMAFESDTFGGLRSESVITLVSLYPELKSDTLVQTQIEVYLANNAKIKELKESKIGLSSVKWWVYFGK